MATYDHIGNHYDQTRCADPFIVQHLITLLKTIPTGIYLDVACGTGNYSTAIAKSGFRCLGIDNSKTMLATAQHKSDHINWLQGDAHNMPLLSDSFNGAFCVLGIHHFDHLEKAFQEISRVIAKGRFILFTSTPEQMRKYWLNEYFPIALEKSSIQMPRLEQVRQALQNVGLKVIDVDPYFVQTDLQDHFLYSGKYHPELYLNSEFRKGISTFQLLTDAKELANGCNRLQDDIQSGRITDVITTYKNTEGDYSFVISETR